MKECKKCGHGIVYHVQEYPVMKTVYYQCGESKCRHKVYIQEQELQPVEDE